MENLQENPIESMEKLCFPVSFPLNQSNDDIDLEPVRGLRPSHRGFPGTKCGRPEETRRLGASKIWGFHIFIRYINW